MLPRALHLRLALLSLMAAVMLVVMPTITPLLAAGAAHASMQVDTHAAGMAMRHAGRHPPAHGEHHDHGHGACAYCPLLAGLMQWRVALPVSPGPPRALVMTPAGLVQARPARIQRDTLGARGPPLSRHA